MIKEIEKEIWEILCLKKVSFAMLYNNAGDILWQKGRKECGKDVKSGFGFARELIYKTWEKPEILESNRSKDRFNLLDSQSVELPDPRVKCIAIIKISHRQSYFLYLESQVQNYFTHEVTTLCTHLVNLLTISLGQAESSQKDMAIISGVSDAIKMVQTRVARYAVEVEPIMLLGETGVGKNHFARLVHQISGRKGKLVQVHTPSIPEELFESEVFGHKKGAFTGAVSDRVGLIEYADNGTLFFDEILEVPLTFQAKLLQFLDMHTYRRLGQSEEKQANVRIIAATNRDLAEEVEEKRFRKDLYYRLNVLFIKIPHCVNEKMI
jgi:transcriptional regulator with GAF, ATPase, and Fis domain